MFSCRLLNQVLADTQILFALYKKHHWLMRGATFYQLHLLLDKHAGEQLRTDRQIAERIATLGGVAVGDPRHVADITCLPRPPDGAEESPGDAVAAAGSPRDHPAPRPRGRRQGHGDGDDGTNDLLVSDVIRTGELQSWFLAEHLVDTPLVRSSEAATA